jgi:hypothetical protein
MAAGKDMRKCSFFYCVGLGFLQKTGFKHRVFEFVRSAFNDIRVVRKVDVFDDASPLQHDRRTFHFQIFDDLNRDMKLCELIPACPLWKLDVRRRCVQLLRSTAP